MKKVHRPVIRLLVFPVLALLCAAAGAEPAVSSPGQGPGGVVGFVSGQAFLSDEQGRRRVIVPGDLVSEGDRIQTSAESHVYVRLRDGGLLVVRPSSDLHVQMWRYEPDQPAVSGISYKLESGAARHVSGQAAKSARERFRFNTPVAAIGVRGTDFTVDARPAVTQVSVKSGAVVVGRLGNGCQAEALGPCEGPSTVTLRAQAAERLAQVRLDERRPRVLDADLADASQASGRAASVDGKPVPMRRAGADDGVGASRTALALDDAVLEETTRARTHPAPELRAPDFRWGRWAALAAGDPGVVSASDVLSSGDLVGINDVYVMAVSRGVQLKALPGDGEARFVLQSHEGLVRDLASGAAVSSTVGESSMVVDFARRRFETSLQVQSALGGGHLRSRGSVQPNGRFASDFFIVDTRVQGSLAAAPPGAPASAMDAAYLYQAPLGASLQASGVATWRH